ncbi:hypothetical protein [Pseudovibrio brasiliensis]|uniref:Uncharacterized protein n=1 Tax=Pseudovibrio brasiliensis TaxID=1898042 RepID=A0ABX8ANY1_9HYPH|nr:hypothetical protein [Pseudovibrio brasiliensis]QUS56352.1 hypothetical protein KGB56_02555 [Pseudovibrio brasiliensis]
MVFEDSWPLEGYNGAIIEFCKNDDGLISTLKVTFKDCPFSDAPTISHDGQIPTITITSTLENKAKYIVQQFSNYINLYFVIKINTEEIDIKYIPHNEEEKQKLKLFNFKSEKYIPKTPLPFSIIAQAFYAGESGEDFSFSANLYQRAAEAYTSENYIESFRHSFLLLEARYGKGKFKTQALFKALTTQTEFVSALRATIEKIKSDPLHQNKRIQEFVSRFQNEQEIVEHLISQRGFYFHGNLLRQDTWHPNKQEAAANISEFSLYLNSELNQNLANKMYAPSVGPKHFKNAQKFGAIVTISISFHFLDHNKFERKNILRINHPGTQCSNAITLFAAEQLIKHFQDKYFGCSLQSAIGVNEKNNEKVFELSFAPVPVEMTS